MGNSYIVSGLLSACLLCSLPSTAEEHEVGQENKAFTVTELKVKIGDTVNFKNHDPFFHNIFSLSDPATFDLGSYPQGEFKGFTFDQAGEVEVECAIHPDMIMTIHVE